MVAGLILRLVSEVFRVVVGCGRLLVGVSWEFRFASRRFVYFDGLFAKLDDDCVEVEVFTNFFCGVVVIIFNSVKEKGEFLLLCECLIAFF